MLADLLLGAVLALAISALTTPVGVSGAVFLVPVQVSILHTPSPAVTPTNLMFNILALPAALLRHKRQGALRGPLLKAMIIGTLPGVVAGAVIRVDVLSGPEDFLAVIACVLIPLGAWLALRPPRPPRAAEGVGRGTSALALVVGAVGGIYGIGGGSILGPILVGRGYPVRDVAPAALATTFVTSLAGVLAYSALSLQASGNVAPDWLLGLGLGAGGAAGAYAGARMQGHLSEGVLGRGLGVLALGLGARYAVLALS